MIAKAGQLIIKIYYNISSINIPIKPCTHINKVNFYEKICKRVDSIVKDLISSIGVGLHFRCSN